MKCSRIALLATALVATAVAATALITTDASADGHVDTPEGDAIVARQAFFRSLGANMGPLAAMAKGDVPYDAAVAEQHAGNLATLGAYDPSPFFLPGTSVADFPGVTEASADIWTDQEGFGEVVARYAPAAQALAAVAGQGQAELGAGLREVGAVCKACHDDYRAKN